MTRETPRGARAPTRECLVMAKPGGPRCNLACAYCYYLGKDGLFPAVQPRRMPEELLERYIAERLSTATVPRTHFEWHGGEPTLLGIDYFEKIVEFEQKHAPPGRTVTNGLQTNGVLLDDAWADFLAAHRFAVGLSLDGPPSVHDRYRKTRTGGGTGREVVGALERLARRRVHCDVLCVVHAANVGSPGAIYQFFRELGVSFLQFLPLVEPTSSAGGVSARTPKAGSVGEFLCVVFDAWIERDVGALTVQLFEEALRPELGLEHALCVFRETCGEAVVLEHDGSVYACDHFVDPEHRLGNLRERSLTDLTSDPALARFGLDKREGLPRACNACDLLVYCNGGCPKDRIVEGAPGEPRLSYLCPAYRRFFSHARPAIESLAEHLRAGGTPRAFRAPTHSSRPPPARAPLCVGPNDPCPCGSGRKFKKCCWRSPSPARPRG